jgi:hypothetical protein
MVSATSNRPVPAVTPQAGSRMEIRMMMPARSTPSNKMASIIFIILLSVHTHTAPEDVPASGDRKTIPLKALKIGTSRRDDCSPLHAPPQQAISPTPDPAQQAGCCGPADTPLAASDRHKPPASAMETMRFA